RGASSATFHEQRKRALLRLAGERLVGRRSLRTLPFPSSGRPLGQFPLDSVDPARQVADPLLELLANLFDRHTASRVVNHLLLQECGHDTSGRHRPHPGIRMTASMRQTADRPTHRQFRPRGLAMALALAILSLVLPGPAPLSAQSPSAAELAERIQARYSQIRDFTAEFVQTQTNPLLPRPVVERGTVKVKKPGRMRWTYTTGDRNETVSDGTRIYNYARADRYVAVADMPDEDDASTALLFLAGHGNLTRDFTVRLPDGQPEDEWHLELTPKTPQADFATLTLQVARNTLAFRGLVIVDEQGGTSAFRFSNLRENVGLTDREF